MIMKLREPKVFTLEEARQTLPFVKRIITDIVSLSGRLSEVDHSIRRTDDITKRKELFLRKEELLSDRRAYQKELDMVGCHLKNSESGLVAYYWDRGDGLIVELLWQYGQDDIYYWNEIGSDKFIPL